MVLIYFYFLNIEFQMPDLSKRTFKSKMACSTEGIKLLSFVVIAIHQYLLILI